MVFNIPQGVRAAERRRRGHGAERLRGGGVVLTTEPDGCALSWWPVTRDRSQGSSLLFPLPDDRTYPAANGNPERTMFADGSRVALLVYDEGSKTWRSAPADRRRTGTTNGVGMGAHPVSQGVIWDDGQASVAGIGALERLDGPPRIAPCEADRIERWVTRLAEYYLAQTPKRDGHPGPWDEVMEGRFAECPERPPYFLYPRIRARIVQVLAERAAQATPGTPTVLVEYVPYVPWTGPRPRVPVAVGDRLMKNARSSDCGAISWVTAIEETTHDGRHGIWVTVQDRLGTWRYSPGAVQRSFVKVD